MKKEWFVADVTAVRSSVRAEYKILRIILDVFWLVQAAFVAGESFCDIGIVF